MSKPNDVQRAAVAALCQFDVLSVEEERRLFDRLKRLRIQESRSPRPANSPELFSGEAIAIRNRIVECNLRLVVSVAKRFAGPRRPLDELVGTAALPLIRCVERFDADRGTRFSTYATRALIHFFAKVCRNRPCRDLPTCSNNVLNQVARDERGPEALERLVLAEDLGRLEDQLARMPARAQALVAGRFGLTADQRPRTFRELGKRHGLSKERARVATSGAVERLRQALRECSAT